MGDTPEYVTRHYWGFKDPLFGGNTIIEHPSERRKFFSVLVFVIPFLFLLTSFVLRLVA